MLGESDCTSSMLGESDCTSSMLGESDSTSSMLGESDCTSSMLGESDCTSSMLGESDCTSSMLGESDCTSSMLGVSDCTPLSFISALEGPQCMQGYPVLALEGHSACGFSYSYWLGASHGLPTLDCILPGQKLGSPEAKFPF